MEEEKIEAFFMLKKFGIKVPMSQAVHVYNQIKAQPAFAKHISQLSDHHTMRDENKFLEVVSTAHKNISEVPNNQNTIQFRDHTFAIRAINPKDIKSMTERAFFNSFNLERNVMNDLEEENKFQKQTSYRQKENKERFSISNEGAQRSRVTEGDQEEKCICGKNIPGSEWVQCINEDKCRGSNWYHFECAGFNAKDLENIKDKDFTCDSCQRFDEDGDDEEESMRSQSRKRVKEDESIME